MTMIRFFVFNATVALLFTGCAENAPTNNGSGAKLPGNALKAAPTKDELLGLEKSAYEAWKSRDAKFWDAFLWDNFVGYGSSGRLDKALASKEYTGVDCAIKSYILSDEQMQLFGNEVALITFKAKVNGTCGGQEVPSDSRAASMYVRAGAQWKKAFHAESAIVDPIKFQAKPVLKKGIPNQGEAIPAHRDAGTDAMLRMEKKVWEAWRAHDGKSIETLTARDLSFINIFGTYFANKADALENWTGTGCDVKSVSISDAVGMMLSPTVGILTFRGGAEGSCYGQKVGPIWGTSVYVKYGDDWKWAFGINVPARW